MSAPNIETIVSLSKRRGFVYPASEIYGGLGSSWDYGPLGVELANNIKNSWWRSVVYERDDIEGLDSAIIQNRLTWKYSGHEDTFSDPMIDCKNCKSRYREDKLVEEFGAERDQSDRRARFRLAPGQHRRPADQPAARQDRLLPLDPVDARRALRGGIEQEGVTEQAHVDGAGVPARGRQAAKDAGLAGGLVEMHRLWIELASEFDDRPGHHSDAGSARRKTAV